jgi:hypothetical protein
MVFPDSEQNTASNTAASEVGFDLAFDKIDAGG